MTPTQVKPAISTVLEMPESGGDLVFIHGSFRKGKATGA